MPEIDHIGYAVRNVDEKKDLMENVLGFKFAERKEYDRGGVISRLDFYEMPGRRHGAGRSERPQCTDQ